MIEVWESIWFWLLTIVLVVFTVLTIVVAIGGFFDCKQLLEAMKSDSEEPS